MSDFRFEFHEFRFQGSHGSEMHIMGCSVSGVREVRQFRRGPTEMLGIRGQLPHLFEDDDDDGFLPFSSHSQGLHSSLLSGNPMSLMRAMMDEGFPFGMEDSWHMQTCRPDLGQEAVSLKVYKRPLNCPSGGLIAFISNSGGLNTSSGIHHQAAVVKTRIGDRYMIEKGVDKKTDEKFSVCHREGECRLVKVSKADLSRMKLVLVKKVKGLRSGVTLKGLFDACGSFYDLLHDNCINGVNRMWSLVQRH